MVTRFPHLGYIQLEQIEIILLWIAVLVLNCVIIRLSYKKKISISIVLRQSYDPSFRCRNVKNIYLIRPFSGPFKAYVYGGQYIHNCICVHEFIGPQSAHMKTVKTTILNLKSLYVIFRK